VHYVVQQSKCGYVIGRGTVKHVIQLLREQVIIPPCWIYDVVVGYYHTPRVCVVAIEIFQYAIAAMAGMMPGVVPIGDVPG